jgi:hypothetical protein
VKGRNEQWLCNPYAGIICAVWMKVVEPFDWPEGSQGPRISEAATLSRRNKNTLWRGEELCEIRLMPLRPQIPPEIQADSRLGRLTVEQRERVKALRRTARRRVRETGALEDLATADPEAELYNRQGEDLLDDSPLSMCFRCCSAFLAPRVPEGDRTESEESLDQTMRVAGFCQDCQKIFYLYDTTADLQQALHRYHKRSTAEHPPSYLEGRYKLFNTYHRPLVMDNGSRHVVLGVSLMKYPEEKAPDELEFPRVIGVKQGQSGAQGVLVNDRVVAINGWWLPPAGHTRLWRTFRQLQSHYLGMDLKVPVQVVEMTWARALADAEPNEEQQAAQAAACRETAAEEAPATSEQVPLEAPQAASVVPPAPTDSSAPEPPAASAVVPASPTSVADTDEANAQTSVTGSPTEVVHTADVEMLPKAEEATEVGLQPAEAADVPVESAAVSAEPPQPAAPDVDMAGVP